MNSSSARSSLCSIRKSRSSAMAAKHRSFLVEDTCSPSSSIPESEYRHGLRWHATDRSPLAVTALAERVTATRTDRGSSLRRVRRHRWFRSFSRCSRASGHRRRPPQRRDRSCTPERRPVGGRHRRLADRAGLGGHPGDRCGLDRFAVRRAGEPAPHPDPARAGDRADRRRATLGDRLDQPSSGQLFHHLKELLAAGVIHQPERGTYAIRREDVIPLLAALSCAIDLAAPHIDEVSP